MMEKISKNRIEDALSMEGGGRGPVAVQRVRRGARQHRGASSGDREARRRHDARPHRLVRRVHPRGDAPLQPSEQGGRGAPGPVSLAGCSGSATATGMAASSSSRSMPRRRSTSSRSS